MPFENKYKKTQILSRNLSILGVSKTHTHTHTHTNIRDFEKSLFENLQSPLLFIFEENEENVPGFFISELYKHDYYLELRSFNYLLGLFTALDSPKKFGMTLFFIGESMKRPAVTDSVSDIFELDDSQPVGGAGGSRVAAAAAVHQAQAHRHDQYLQHNCNPRHNHNINANSIETDV